jgi:hypothetical protein
LQLGSTEKLVFWIMFGVSVCACFSFAALSPWPVAPVGGSGAAGLPLATAAAAAAAAPSPPSPLAVARRMLRVCRDCCSLTTALSSVWVGFLEGFFWGAVAQAMPSKTLTVAFLAQVG